MRSEPTRGSRPSPSQAAPTDPPARRLLSTESGEIRAFQHYDRSKTYKVDREVAEARTDDYDGLVLPGGVGNPDTLRQDEDAVEFVRSFFEAGKPVAAICHA